MGNRITPELAAGMIRSLVDILAAGVGQPEASASVSEPQTAKEVGHGMV